MTARELFQDNKEYTYKEIQKILRSNSKKQVDLWLNVRGWDIYFTKEPTFATPAGQSRKRIKLLYS